MERAYIEDAYSHFFKNTWFVLVNNTDLGRALQTMGMRKDVYVLNILVLLHIVHISRIVLKFLYFFLNT